MTPTLLALAIIHVAVWLVTNLFVLKKYNHLLFASVLALVGNIVVFVFMVPNLILISLGFTTADTMSIYSPFTLVVSFGSAIFFILHIVINNRKKSDQIVKNYSKTVSKNSDLGIFIGIILGVGLLVLGIAVVGALAIR
jgi:hypothetical protein